MLHSSFTSYNLSSLPLAMGCSHAFVGCLWLTIPLPPWL